MTGSDGWGDDRPGGRRLRFSLDRKYAHHDRDEHEYEHQKGESRFIHPPSWQGECEQTGANIDEEGHRRLSRLILSKSTCSCRNRASRRRTAHSFPANAPDGCDPFRPIVCHARVRNAASVFSVSRSFARPIDRSRSILRPAPPPGRRSWVPDALPAVARTHGRVNRFRRDERLGESSSGMPTQRATPRLGAKAL